MAKWQGVCGVKVDERLKRYGYLAMSKYEQPQLYGSFANTIWL